MSIFEPETKEYPKIPKADQVKYPLGNIIYHNTLQFAKLGSVVGVLALYPLRNRFAPYKTVIWSIVGAMHLSIPVSAQKWWVMSKAGIEDRAFRIKHNKIVRDSDMMFYLGGFFGGIFGNCVGLMDPKKNAKLMMDIHSVRRRPSTIAWAGVGSTLGFITMGASMAGKYTISGSKSNSDTK
jgi:hypothetical protein